MVPASIESGSDSARVSVKALRTELFKVVLEGINGSGIAAVRGLHMSIPKVPVPPSGIGLRHQYIPGIPQFDDIAIDMSTSSATLTGFEQWVNDITRGVVETQTGTISALDPSDNTLQATLGGVDLSGLLPAAFPPFMSGPGRRTILLHVGEFRLRSGSNQELNTASLACWGSRCLG